MSETDTSVYVVDDDRSMRESVASLLRSAGMRVETFASAQEFLARRRTEPGGCLILDVKLPGLSGLDLQQELAKAGARIPIIFITGYADVPMSVRAMKSGAVEFFTKPFDDEQLLAAVRHALARPPGARQDRADAHDAPELVGSSPAFQGLLRRIALVAPTDSSVLVLGETGTGKELVAREIHARSPRSTRPLVTVNCGAIQQTLIASELFGHEKGAFTGALHQRAGRFELADGGTIFLDEIGELPHETQVALLRVLQEREFERVGGNKTIRVDVRVIAATNRDLAAAVADGKFRADLFYRLNVFPLHVPALRDRREDIPLLVEHFVRRHARASRTEVRSMDDRTLERLSRYRWPGNIRELQNVVERWAITGGGEDLSLDEGWLPSEPAQDDAPAAQPFPAPPPRRDEELAAAPVNLTEHVESLEREIIRRTMIAAGGNQSEAARRLGLSRGALIARLRKYGAAAETPEEGEEEPRPR